MLGRTHAALRRNCQDALTSGQGEWGAFGVVSDGCGSAAHSEVGATLTAAVAGNVLRASLRRGARPTEAIRAAHASVVECLQRLAISCATSIWEADAFNREHLLSTLVAFAMTAEETAIAMIGDGIVRVDDAEVARKHDDAPGYVSMGGGGEVFRTITGARVVAIATDGFDPASFAEVGAIQTPDLTRHMRVRQRDGAFADDASIVVARRAASTDDSSALSGGEP